MVKHYLVVALRNARSTPIATAINVFTLALGLACFLAAYGVASFWDRSERHFANADRTFVVTTNVTPREGGTGGGNNPVSNPYVAQFKFELPIAVHSSATAARARALSGFPLARLPRHAK